MVFYTYKDLQGRLKEEGLPFSRMYLNVLEKMGIFNRPPNALMLHKGDEGISRKEMRIFTKEDIELIVKKVRDFTNK